eukprot:gene8413-9272_t
MEVMEVADLVHVYGDEAILDQIRQRAGIIAVKKFMAAQACTKILQPSLNIIKPSSTDLKPLSGQTEIGQKRPPSASNEQLQPQPPAPPSLGGLQQMAVLGNTGGNADNSEGKLAYGLSKVQIGEPQRAPSSSQATQLPSGPVGGEVSRTDEYGRQQQQKLEEDKRTVALQLRRIEEERRKMEEERSTFEAQQRRRAEIEQLGFYLQQLGFYLQQVTSVDLAFLVDCTGSIGLFIATIRDNIVEFVKSIHKLHPTLTLRIAFVGYRDFCDEDRLVIHPFTENAEDIQNFLCTQRAVGGGDEAHDVLGGLEVADNNLDWLAETRILYHIGDAPGHGEAFHDSKVTDNYPKEYGLEDYRRVLRSLYDKKVRYFFGKIKDTTDIMISRFNELIGSKYILETPLRPSEMMNEILRSVVNSTRDAIAHSCRGANPKKDRQQAIKLDLNEPDWDNIDMEGLIVYNMTTPMSMEAMVNEATDRCVHDTPVVDETFAMIAKIPFAKGALRAAHYGKLVKIHCLDVIDVVIKFALADKDQHATRLPYERFLVCHRTAYFMAKEFKKVNIGRNWPRVEYVEAKILQLMTRWPNPPFVICEDRIPREAVFEKYNSNTGYCAPCPTAQNTNHEIIQAFSHWSYEVTNKHLMIVDCQGGFVENGVGGVFYLTDPAIHSVNVLKYGRTNLGEKGFGYFFKSHQCNDYCRSLGLPQRSTADSL